MDKRKILNQEIDTKAMGTSSYLLGLMNKFNNRFQTVADAMFEEISWKQEFFSVTRIAWPPAAYSGLRGMAAEKERWKEKMLLREYLPSDCWELSELFYRTIHTVNAKDYTKEQLDAWASGQVDLEKWNRSLQEHYSVVAVEDEIIVGFGDIDQTGYLDRLFVHAAHQGKGVATAICNQLEQAVRGNITAHASITARPFFEKRGYRVIKEQQVERQGRFLANYVMEKER